MERASRREAMGGSPASDDAGKLVEKLDALQEDIQALAALLKKQEGERRALEARLAEREKLEVKT